MNRLQRAVKEDGDKLLTDILFVGFGVWSLIDRPVSWRFTPDLFVLVFNIEFIIIGMILLTGTIFQNYRVKMLGFGLYIMALITVAGVVSFVSTSAVSLLVLAFAVRGYTSIKEMRTQRKFLCDLRSTLRSPPED